MTDQISITLTGKVRFLESLTASQNDIPGGQPQNKTINISHILALVEVNIIAVPMANKNRSYIVNKPHILNNKSTYLNCDPTPKN